MLGVTFTVYIDLGYIGIILGLGIGNWGIGALPQSFDNHKEIAMGNGKNTTIINYIYIYTHIPLELGFFQGSAWVV